MNGQSRCSGRVIIRNHEEVKNSSIGLRSILLDKCCVKDCSSAWIDASSVGLLKESCGNSFVHEDEEELGLITLLEILDGLCKLPTRTFHF